jgi:DNA-binding CsgD family transcriptional regulator
MTRANLENLIGTIYAAAPEPQGWGRVLRELTQLISGSAAGMHVHDSAGTSFTFNADYNNDPAAFGEYVQHYHQINPLIEPLSRLPAGAVVSDRSLVPREILMKTEYAQGYARKFGMGGAAYIAVGREGAHRSCITIIQDIRSEPFSSQQLALLQRLSPHLQRSLALNRRFEALRLAMDAMSGTLDRLEMGVLLLNGSGTVIHANAVGEALLCRRDGLYAVQGKLRCTDPEAEHALETAVRDALTRGFQRGGFVAVKRGEGRRLLTVRVTPLPEGHLLLQSAAAARAIVFITDPEAQAVQQSPAGYIMAAYGLTAAEMRMVEALAAGDTVSEAAAKLGIRLATARNHLNHALAKTGVRRQAELVRLLLSSKVPVR